MARGRKRLETPSIQQVTADYAAGMTQKQTAEKYGVSQGFVSRRLAEGREGKPVRRNARRTATGRLTDFTRGQIVKAYTDGMPVRQLCAVLGVDSTTMYRVLRTEGVALRPSRTRRAFVEATTAVAAELGVDAEVLRELLAARGIRRLSGSAE